MGAWCNGEVSDSDGLLAQVLEGVCVYGLVRRLTFDVIERRG